uniref:Uncharacterized protein n=1 Tax=Tanacetum cinerariifolium TaxID=118510 RepID=A0A6L2MBY9_TANCI|nr:hypothetical protein [Tanacetum cinerariifolium]
MYYPRFIKVVIHHFMSKDPSIPRRNKVNWHYVRNDYMFSTIKLVSKHQNTQPFGALLRTRSSSDTSITPPTAATSSRLTISTKGKQTAKASKAKSLSALSENFTNDEGADNERKDGDDDEEDKGDDCEEGDGEGNGDEDIGLNIDGEEGHVEEEEEDELYRDVNINQGMGLQTNLEVETRMNLYKALVKAYESDKIILDTYGETVTLKRRRDDDVDNDKEPSVGLDQGSKRHRERKEPESAIALTETATRSAGSIQPWISELAKRSDSHSSFNELMDTPLDFTNFLINQLKVDTLTLELLTGPTYELMKGSCKSLVELEYHLKEVFKATTDQLDWVNPEEWHNYKHLDWIIAQRDDDKLYKFKEGNFKRLRIQDIKDMLLLFVQGKLTNLTVKEHFTFNVSLRMFTRSIVIQRRVEDLQLGVESYQKKLNLTKLDSYRSDLKRKEAYTAYSNL